MTTSTTAPPTPSASLELWDKEQIAAFLHRSPKTVMNWRARGEFIPATSTRRRKPLWDRRAVEAWALEVGDAA